MKAAARFVFVASSLFGAETAGSWFVWIAAPTDTIRVQYHGFWDFELGRLRDWAPVLGLLLASWTLIWYLLRRHFLTKDISQWDSSRYSVRLWTAAAASAIALELLTSILYW